MSVDYFSLFSVIANWFCITCLIMRPYKSKETFRHSKRRFNKCRAMKRAKLKDSVGTIQTKNLLRCSLLNVEAC